VLPSGEVMKTRRRARKSSAAFDTTKLFIRSEGTLGIVTELTVRLAPVLATSVAVSAFPDVRAATRASTAIVTAGAGVQCIELVDANSMRATNVFNARPAAAQYAETDSLFVKLQGPTSRAIEESVDIAERIAKEHGATDFRRAASKQEADDLWMDR
jgi:D-lactate dehydrogenase (cytochrome)